MRIAALLLALVLSACATPAKYTPRADIGDALKQNFKDTVNVGTFKAPEGFSSMCRLSGPIYPPDYNMTFEGYIQNALIEELKAAGKFDDQKPKVVLSGAVEKLAFSTTANGVSGGTWDIGLRVTSSNGKSTVVSEHYEFDASIMGDIACGQATEAFLPAVQNLISKLVTSSDMPMLLASADAVVAQAKSGAVSPRNGTAARKAGAAHKGSAARAKKAAR